ncbi:uncharacterized protein TRUGW13939_06827 [Talaromyces rugulosus]|uniref:Methyltransferase domain-containing protein n=1 Tax=Talaromyces rugulosus TaxID=121627 RepID=A0A7H8R0C0_TALRU|nr:uncharacterized protein TRUGW13939_06827 [Talaromyces rugulosus]QKX59687.1 hypothetical protein TRUGW13939_06827 [Talaromyces rugulosus]
MTSLRPVAFLHLARRAPRSTPALLSSRTMASYRQAKDWSADQYLKFAEERTRPARDLLAQIRAEAPQRVVDLGCGPGNSTQVLADRWPNAHITGMDSSPDMVDKARKTLPQLDFELGDLATWTPPSGSPVDVYFSNAVFQWMPSDQRLPLISRLIQTQASGGVFAFQVPDNFLEPSHAMMRETAADGGPWTAVLKDRQPALAKFQSAQDIYNHLSPLCASLNIWHTHYYHILDSHEAVVEWVKGTGLRPFIDPLSDEDRQAFVASYLARLQSVYPTCVDGKVILKYPRLQKTAEVADAQDLHEKSLQAHSVAEEPERNGSQDPQEEQQQKQDQGRAHGFLQYIRTRDFWLVLLLGQVIALADISSSTFSSLLSYKGTSIPAFQTLWNYVLLNIVYTGITIYKYGFKKWFKMLYTDCWKYFILSFLDVEGNYFMVLAYRYTSLLSAELFSFWTIICVVFISAVFLRRRYHITQYLGIFVACGGLGMLIASDHLRGANYPAEDQLKGDLFALLASTIYAFSNLFEEFMVSKRPMYEVIGQMGFWGMLINGVQCAIFDRSSFHGATWDSQVGGYIAGYTIVLFIFYTLAPIMLRISSATFFNISLLTMNFWGLIIGIQVFHYTVQFLYPIAFVLIVLGLFIYFVKEGSLGESTKPWLGNNQERGIDGVGTGRRAQATGHAIV